MRSAEESRDLFRGGGGGSEGDKGGRLCAPCHPQSGEPFPPRECSSHAPVPSSSVPRELQEACGSHRDQERREEEREKPQSHSQATGSRLCN